MSTITAKIPIVIKIEESYEFEESLYYVTPLLSPKPYATDTDPDLAINKLKLLLKSLLENADRDSQLLCMFNPEITYSGYVELMFNFGKFQVKGNFFVVVFEVNGYQYVLFPDLNYFMFILRADRSIPDEEILIRAVQTFLREEKARLKDDFEIHRYTEPQSIKVDTIEVELSLKDPEFPFEIDISKIFSSLREWKKFNGEEELEKVGYNLFDLYPSQLMHACCVDEIIDRLYELIFCNEDNIPIVIVGPPLVGKTTVIHETIRRYIENGGKEKVVWHIDPNRIISGMSIVGQWERRFEAILQHAKRNGIKLYVDNIIALLRIGKSAHSDLTLSDALIPYLTNRDLQIICEATPEEWDRAQEINRRFAELFHVIRLNEPPRDKAMEIIIRKIFELERYHWVRFAGDISRTLPKIILEEEQFKGSDAFHGRVIKRIISTTQDFHMNQSAERVFNKEHLSMVSNSLIGQEKAIESIRELVEITEAGLNDPSKPLGSFLFVGPTGVGKSHAAQVIAHTIFRGTRMRGKRLVKIEMNKFVDEDAAARLLSPNGLLVSSLRSDPWRVILFDEIEKAHPSVHDLLLQILDEGRLTDKWGQTVDFTKSLIIMTSNLGAVEAQKMVGFEKSEDEMEAVYLKALKRFFRPEFLNRIDKIVVFNRLSKKDIFEIAEREVVRLLRRRDWDRRPVVFRISQEALKMIAERGFDPEYGARALKRQIEKDLISLAAEKFASAPVEIPFIFEVHKQGEQLVPLVIPLEEAEKSGITLPRINDIEMLLERLSEFREVSRRALHRLEEVTENQGEAVERRHWPYYVLKDKARELIDELDKILEEAEEFRKDPKLLFSSKGARYHRWKKTMVTLRDLQSQYDIITYLNEVEKRAKTIFDDLQVKFLDFYLRVGFLDFLSKGNVEDLIICIRMNLKDDYYDENIGRPLVKDYLDFVTEVGGGIEAKKIIQTDFYRTFYALVSGLRLKEVFRQECGFHLFVTPRNGIIPVTFELLEYTGERSFEEICNRHAGLYQEWMDKMARGEASVDDYPYEIGKVMRIFKTIFSKQKTIFDVSTGLTWKGRLLSPEFRYVVYHRLPQGEILKLESSK